MTGDALQGSPALFTIGYERRTQPELIETLIAAGATLLVDVRAIAASRRAGFSKTVLSTSLAAHGIGYRHMRALGTPKPGRDAARAGRTAEMQAIFARHLENPEAGLALAQAADLARHGPICLLCLEHDAACCHRAMVADRIMAETGQAVINL